MVLPSQHTGDKFHHTISSSSASPSLIPLKHIRIHRLATRITAGNRTLQYQYTRPFSSLAVASSHSSDLSTAIDAPEFTSTVGSPPAVPFAQWNLGPRHSPSQRYCMRDMSPPHSLFFHFVDDFVAISSSWLFFSAIPTLLAFRKALESVEKLLEVTVEELPDTMASVRQSGLEISDLTRELSDLGEEITEGIRSSTRPLRVAEDRFRQLTSMTPQVMVQGQNGPMEITKRPTPQVARAARELREGISKGCDTFEMINSVVGFSRRVFRSGRKKHM